MPRRKRRHFILGKDLRSDGHVRITKGKDFVVEGGTKDSHEETADIVQEFSKRLAKEGSPPGDTAREILKEVLDDRKRKN